VLDSYLKPIQTRNERATGRSLTIHSGGGGGGHHSVPARSFVDCLGRGVARLTALDGDAGSGEAPGAAVTGEPALLHSEPPNHGEGWYLECEAARTVATASGTVGREGQWNGADRDGAINREEDRSPLPL